MGYGQPPQGILLAVLRIKCIGEQLAVILTALYHVFANFCLFVFSALSYSIMMTSYEAPFYIMSGIYGIDH